MRGFTLKKFPWNVTIQNGCLDEAPDILPTMRNISLLIVAIAVACRLIHNILQMIFLVICQIRNLQHRPNQVWICVIKVFTVVLARSDVLLKFCYFFCRFCSLFLALQVNTVLLYNLMLSKHVLTATPNFILQFLMHNSTWVG